MPQSRLLVFDLDGTLLNSSHRIPADVRTMLMALRGSDVETTLATGRPFAAVQEFIGELELQLPLIVFNGAVVITPDGRQLSVRPLPLSPAKRILDLLEETSAANHLYLQPTDEWFYTDQQGAAAEHITKKDGIGFRYIPSLLDVLSDATSDPVKMFSIGPRNELERLKETIQRTESTVSCVFSEHDMLEFLGPNVNKGTALEILCDSIGAVRESVFAFGDNMNDFEMLQVAGTGVSMDTAPDELQAEADWIIRDIAAFLRDHLGEAHQMEATNG